MTPLFDAYHRLGPQISVLLAVEARMRRRTMKDKQLLKRGRRQSIAIVGAIAYNLKNFSPFCERTALLKRGGLLRSQPKAVLIFPFFEHLRQASFFQHPKRWLLEIEKKSVPAVR